MRGLLAYGDPPLASGGGLVKNSYGLTGIDPKGGY
ncbi:hypothetical protein A1Y7_01778 [Escherichia coli KTE119]|nr:hypothetical protein A1Y7_01778 [Escherichia coli KTE119]